MIEEETTHKPTFSERERERDYDVALADAVQCS